jgi:putative hydrolase of the HAD superfamily
VARINKIPGGTRAIFLDAGGTLFRPFPSVGHHYSVVAAKYGCKVSVAEVEAAFRRVWGEHDKIGGMHGQCNEKIEKEFWRRIVSEVFKGFGPFTDFDSFFNELHDLFACPEVWKFYPESEEVLQQLKAKGYILCLVSNWDSRLVKLCEGLGLDRFMDHYVISAMFGVAKPDSRIFREALRKTGVKAEEAVHIGDSLEDDILGANQAGIKAVWLDRSDRHGTLTKGQQDLVTVIRDLRELIQE